MRCASMHGTGQARLLLYVKTENKRKERDFEKIQDILERKGAEKTGDKGRKIKRHGKNQGDGYLHKQRRLVEVLA